MILVMGATGNVGREVVGILAAAAELMSLAAERGVRRVVLLSGLAVENGEASNPLAARFGAIERAVRACGLPWTVLRPGPFAVNALAWAPRIRSGGVVRDVYGDAAGASIHERDIAAVAARALACSGHAGRSYPLTGPRPLTTRDQVRIIGEAIGGDLSCAEMPREEAPRALTSYHGIPEAVVGALLEGRAASVRGPGRLGASAGPADRHRGGRSRPPGAHVRRVGSRS